MAGKRVALYERLPEVHRIRDGEAPQNGQLKAYLAPIEDAFSAVIAGAHRVPGAVWSLGKTLIDNAVRVRSPSREKASAPA